MRRKRFKLIAGVVIGSGFLFANTSLIDQCFHGSKIACKELSQNRQTLTQLEEKCLNQKDEKACIVAEKILRVNGDRREISKFISQEEEACKKGNGGACVALGGLYYYGKGVSKDYTRAVELYKKACEMGDGLGCNNLGVMYEDGKGVSKDYTRARKLYKKACEMGDGWGCKNLGVMYEDGKGVSKDYTRARELFKKACEMGSGRGCDNLEYLLLER